MTKVDVFEDIAVSLDYWADAASDALTKLDADLTWVEDPGPYQRIREALSNAGVGGDAVRMVFAECIRGFAVSILSTIDGGTVLAEKGRISLVNEDGESLGEGLHDDFVGHLFDTDRLQ